MPARRLALLPLAALAAAGCGAQPAAAPPPPLAGGVALLRSAVGRTLVIGGGGARALPAGSVAADGRRVFTARASGGATVVRAVAVRSGRTLASRRLAGRWALPATVASGVPDALSPNGTTLVLVDRDGARSRVALLDVSLRERAQVVTLPARFTYDAVDPEVGLLYLIEDHGGGHYSVRAYDLLRGALRPGAIVDKREPGEAMAGLPTSRATSDDGNWVYTLYRRADDVPFVHALDVGHGFALCLDLPPGTRSSPAAAREWGLVLAPSQRTLYAANPALGALVELSAQDGVRRVARLPRGAIGANARAAVSPDGTTLYVPTARGVAVVDTATLRARRTLLAGHRVTAVAVSGARLYAEDGAVVALDRRTGRVL
jgi:outer membrane protein assembly factor BamB